MYKTIKERMVVSLRRTEAEATGKPLYTSYQDVEKGLYSPTQCKKMKQPIRDGEKPDAYVLNRNWLGYLPLTKERKAGESKCRLMKRKPVSGGKTA